MAPRCRCTNRRERRRRHRRGLSQSGASPVPASGWVLLARGLTFGQIDSQDGPTDKLTQDDAKHRATEPAPVVILQLPGSSP